MTVLTLIGVTLAAWCVCALVVGLVVGRCLALGSRPVPGRDDQPSAAAPAAR